MCNEISVSFYESQIPNHQLETECIQFSENLVYFLLNISTPRMWHKDYGRKTELTRRIQIVTGAVSFTLHY